MKKYRLMNYLGILFLIAMACEGPEGPEGPQGPMGPQGQQGAAGATGAKGEPGESVVGEVIYSDWITVETTDWTEIPAGTFPFLTPAKPGRYFDIETGSISETIVNQGVVLVYARFCENSWMPDEVTPLPFDMFFDLGQWDYLFNTIDPGLLRLYILHKGERTPPENQIISLCDNEFRYIIIPGNSPGGRKNYHLMSYEEVIESLQIPA